MKYAILHLRPAIYFGAPAPKDGFLASTTQNPQTHLINIGPTGNLFPPGLPRDATIIEAWYSPLERLEDLAKFGIIEVSRADDTHINLTIRANAVPSGSTRLKVYVLYALPQ